MCKNRNGGGKIPPSEGLRCFDSELGAGSALEKPGVGLWGECLGGCGHTRVAPGRGGGDQWTLWLRIMQQNDSPLVVCDLQLNPWRRDAGSVTLFSVFMSPGADSGSDFGAAPTSACSPALPAAPSPPRPRGSPEAAEEDSSGPRSAARTGDVAVGGHPRSVSAGLSSCYTRLPPSAASCRAGVVPRDGTAGLCLPGAGREPPVYLRAGSSVWSCFQKPAYPSPALGQKRRDGRAGSPAQTARP